MNGSGEVNVNLDVGAPDIFTGITQFRSTTTTAAKEQDGFAMGKLSEVSISENGEISGLYTNGTSRTIAKILLAEFTNSAGLLRTGDSMWAESNNSGEGVMYAAGEGTTSKIKPGALEMSNVELAGEFTDLITTQRGYQAASKIITTSDSLLQELVQLVR
jgi:flagellar hook protein FlgE